MKELIFGPSGAGKTYLSTELRKQGVNAIDADTIEGLSSWYDGIGNKVPYQEDADQDFLDNHSFLWDRDFLQDYLNKNPDVYIFGASGNVFDMVNLFDKVYFLKVDPEVQRERLMLDSRENPMGNTEYQRENAIKWGQELEDQARASQIPFLDASLSPQEIFNVLKQK